MLLDDGGGAEAASTLPRRSPRGARLGGRRIRISRKSAPDGIAESGFGCIFCNIHGSRFTAAGLLSNQRPQLHPVLPREKLSTRLLLPRGPSPGTAPPVYPRPCFSPVRTRGSLQCIRVWLVAPPVGSGLLRTPSFLCAPNSLSPIVNRVNTEIVSCHGQDKTILHPIKDKACGPVSAAIRH